VRGYGEVGLRSTAKRTVSGLDLLRRALAGTAAFLNRPTVAGVLLAGVCFLVATSALQPIWDSDFGWHVALGRYIAEQRAVPDAEPFTHTARGAPMVAHEWLAQLLYHGIVEAVGVGGLRLAQAGLLVGVLVLFFRMLRRAEVPPALALIGVFTYVVIAEGRFAPRPQTLSLCLTMLLFDRVFLRRSPLTDGQLAGFYLMMVVWANLHSAAVLFPALVALYLAVEGLQRWLGWRSPRPEDLGGGNLKRVAVLAGLAGVATLATPNHLRLIPYILESNRINRRLSGEWFSVVDAWRASSGGAWDLYLLALVAVAVVLAALAGRRRYSPATLAVVFFLTALPLSSQRFVDLYFAPLLFAFAELARALRANRLGPLPGQLASVAGIALVLASAMPAIPPRLDRAPFAAWLGRSQHFAPIAFPVGAVDFLDAVALDCRMFNLERWGGYILLHTYDAYPIFIDGRWVTVGERVARDARRIEGRLPGTFDKLDAYDVDLLLVPRGWMTDRIQQREGWLPIFENFNAGVYLRDGPESAENLRRVAAYYAALGIPFDPAVGFDGRAARRANRGWARQFRVQRKHVQHFRIGGTPAGVSRKRLIDRW
jgi:hypothetical protein